MTHRRPIGLTDVKVTLSQFADSQSGRPFQKVEAEFGDLLLYLIRLAEKAGIDLLDTAQKQVGRRSKALTRIVWDKSR